MIDTNVEFIIAVCLPWHVDVIRGQHSRSVRKRKIAQHFFSNEVNPILRNDIARELISSHLASRRIDNSSDRIVDGDFWRPREGFREIAYPLEFRWDLRQRRDSLNASSALVVEEEEGAVLSNWTSNGTS